MLKRLYIDNYKCFVNFELPLDRFVLIGGVNGTGKSTVFEVLSKLRDLIGRRASCEDVFVDTSLTRWDLRREQLFELDVEGNGGTYTYRLVIEFDKKLDTARSRIKEELLQFDKRPIFESDLGHGRLYRDDFSEGPEATFDWTKSGIGALAQRRDNTKLTWFRDWVNTLYCIRLEPSRMSSRSESEAEHPDDNFSNFASWFRHLRQERSVNELNDLDSALKGLFPGYDSLHNTSEGEKVRALRLRQKIKGVADPVEFAFDELSDGQRCLIALYTIACMGKGSTVCIDEPENYVALSELQPWLANIHQRTVDGEQQVLLASHHPEALDYLAKDHGVLLTRQENGPVRVARFSKALSGPLKPSEIVARGWEDTP